MSSGASKEVEKALSAWLLKTGNQNLCELVKGEHHESAD